jgi:cation transport protein ChaC
MDAAQDVATGVDVASEPTRARWRDAATLSALRASAPAGMSLRSDAELEASLEHILLEHDDATDLHVFAYGSLMWNPALEYTQAQLARIHGWHRSFCLRSLLGRGSVGEPGLMLALDRGGACHGMLFRIPKAKVRDELSLLWRREMTWGSYDARWVTASVGRETRRALTFVVRRANERYVRQLPVEQIAHLIKTGRGSLGTCRSYFDATLEKLEAFGIKDAGMERIRLALAAV